LSHNLQLSYNTCSVKIAGSAFMYWLFTTCFQSVKTQVCLLYFSRQDTSQWWSRTLDKYL